MNKCRSAPAGLAEEDKLPISVRHRCLVPQDVETVVIRTNHETHVRVRTTCRALPRPCTRVRRGGIGMASHPPSAPGSTPPARAYRDYRADRHLFLTASHRAAPTFPHAKNTPAKGRRLGSQKQKPPGTSGSFLYSGVYFPQPARRGGGRHENPLRRQSQPPEPGRDNKR